MITSRVENMKMDCNKQICSNHSGKMEVIREYVKSHSDLTDAQVDRFIRCYMQNNTIETVAYKLGQPYNTISYLYYGLSIYLMQKALSALA